MSREAPARFCERRRVRLPPPTHLALRHQVTVLRRQLGTHRPRFSPADRVFLAALLHRLPRDVLGRFRLLIRPDTEHVG